MIRHDNNLIGARIILTTSTGCEFAGIIISLKENTTIARDNVGGTYEIPNNKVRLWDTPNGTNQS